MITEGSKLVEDAKQKYFAKISRNLSNPSTGSKLYWTLVNKMLNKAKIPEIPPLLENDVFVLDFISNAQIFKVTVNVFWVKISIFRFCHIPLAELSRHKMIPCLKPTETLKMEEISFKRSFP